MHKLALSPLVAALLLGLSGCGGRESPGESANAAADAAQPSPAPVPAAFNRTTAPEGASVAILSPRQGDTARSPVRVVFDVQGMSLAPAGDATPATGHHHLLVDVTEFEPDRPLPADERHLHFGKAQTEAEIELPPGEHTLMLVLGDANHVPHDPPVRSEPIRITVE